MNDECKETSNANTNSHFQALGRSLILPCDIEFGQRHAVRAPERRFD